MWSDYRGSKPASEMGPPTKTPSATIRPRSVVPCPLCFRVECLDPVLHVGMLEARLAFSEAFGRALTRAVLDATQHGTRPKE